MPFHQAGPGIPTGDQWWSISRYVVNLVTCHIYHDSGDVIAEKYRAPTAAFSGADDLGAGGSACALSADAL